MPDILDLMRIRKKTADEKSSRTKWTHRKGDGGVGYGKCDHRQANTKAHICHVHQLLPSR